MQWHNCFIQITIMQNLDIDTNRIVQEHLQCLVHCKFARVTIQVSLDIVRATVQYFLVHMQFRLHNTGECGIEDHCHLAQRQCTLSFHIQNR